MGGMPWFRMYAEMIEDPKVGTLDDACFRTWVELLCVACENGGNGDTGMSVEQLAWKLRRNVTETLHELFHRSLISEKNGENGAKTIFINKWEKRQFGSDSSTDRVRKYRLKQQKPNCNVTETLPKRFCNAIDTDRDTDKHIESTSVDSCAELSPKAPALPPVISIPLSKKGQEFHVTQALLDQYADSYPGVDVMLALKDIRQWNLDNPGKRKTKTGVKGHITRWLSRAQNKGEYRRKEPATCRTPDWL